MDQLQEAINNLPNQGFDETNLTTILNFVYSLGGILAAAFIVYGGVLYITSQGDAAKAKKAQSTLLFAVIGLGVVILAAAITTMVTTIAGGA